MMDQEAVAHHEAAHAIVDYRVWDNSK